MRILLILILSFIANSCFADYVTCYSRNEKIYQNHARAVYYDNGMFIIDEGKHKGVVFYNADCLVHVDKNQRTTHKK